MFTYHCQMRAGYHEFLNFSSLGHFVPDIFEKEFLTRPEERDLPRIIARFIIWYYPREDAYVIFVESVHCWEHAFKPCINGYQFRKIAQLAIKRKEVSIHMSHHM